MALLEPLYKEFRSKSEQLIASFSNKDLKVLEAYFSGAIEIMNASTRKLNDKS
jgi:hypothetical protein